MPATPVGMTTGGYGHCQEIRTLATSISSRHLSCVPRRRWYTTLAFPLQFAGASLIANLLQGGLQVQPAPEIGVPGVVRRGDHW